MSSAHTVLLTGFDPFGGAERNPSGDIALALDGRVIAGARIHGVVLPTAYDASVQRILAEIARLAPAVVLSLGVAEGRKAVTVERVGLNLDDAKTVDNTGEQRFERPIQPDGPAALFSPLPVRAMADAIEAAGVEAGVSTSAGTFVCNHVLYSVLAALGDSPTRAGFIHVPALPGTVADDVPTMSLEAMTRAVEAALEAAITG
ncbi:MAG: pyroglutamyl-peptidase I [Chloroflexota bacterium]